MSRCPELSGFTETNDTFIDVAIELSEQALLAALDDGGVKPWDVDIVFSATVTGLAPPTLDAPLMTREGPKGDRRGRKHVGPTGGCS